MRIFYRTSRWAVLNLFIYILMPVCHAGNNELDCFGTEPFWDMSVVNQTVKFKINDERTISLKVAKPETAAGTSIDYLKVYKSYSNQKNAILLIQKQVCSDGMSDRSYPYQVIFLHGDDAYIGCCSKK